MTQANARHRAGGTSRRALAAAATLGIVTTTVLSSTGTAFAAPQGGVTTDGGDTQGGVTTNGGGTQGGVTTPEPQPQPQPQPVEDRDYWIPPPSQEIRQAPARPNPSQTTTAPQPSTTTTNNNGGGGGGGGNNAAPVSNPQPVRPQQLHAPVYVEPVAPIAPPVTDEGEVKLRIGTRVSDQPNWMTDKVLERTNNTAAGWEAEVGTFWRSVGLEADQADRVAATTTASTAIGAGIGATTLGLPAAAVGAGIGGILGGALGGVSTATVMAVVAPVLPPVILATVPAATLATAAGAAGGAAAGAAILGGPAALVGAGIGGGIGFAWGTAFGAGDFEDNETVEVDLPQLADPDTEQITQQAEQVTSDIASNPVGKAAVDAVVGVPAAVDQAVADTRAAIADVGGQEALDSVDAASEQFARDTEEARDIVSPVTDRIDEAVAAAADGINAAVNPEAAPAPEPAPVPEPVQQQAAPAQAQQTPAPAPPQVQQTQAVQQAPTPTPAPAQNTQEPAGPVVPQQVADTIPVQVMDAVPDHVLEAVGL